MKAQVVQISKIESHPNADRLDILHLKLKYANTVQLVTGKHYVEGQLGIWIQPETMIPGYLARDLWLSSKGDTWFEVREIEMRGIPSPGLFVGELYTKDTNDWKSIQRYEDLLVAGAQNHLDGATWLRWPLWRKDWKLGDDVSDYLGVVYPIICG